MEGGAHIAVSYPCYAALLVNLPLLPQTQLYKPCAHLEVKAQDKAVFSFSPNGAVGMNIARSAWPCELLDSVGNDVNR